MKKNYIAILLTAFATNVAVADCQSLKPLGPGDVNSAKPDLLFKNMLAACKSGAPERFFALQSKKSSYLLSKLSSSDKSQLFSQYCTFTQEANKTLGGHPESGIHSFKQDNYKTTECGQKMSFWYVHSKNGALALRLEVTLENGQLRIDTH